ncbi:MAG TPA: DNA repair protein RecO, partial [Bacteroidetes bacterium]|nr:DNA repair protein RecO [Bacteroidota bacterium]
EVVRGAVGMFMVEVARKSIRGEERHQALFDFLLHYFLYLDETSRFANLHLHFMAHLSRHLGFWPNGSFLPQSPFFDMQEGRFVPDQPHHPYWLGPDMARRFHQLLQHPKEQCHHIALNRGQRQSLLRSLITYYRLHIENFPVIHSLDVLEEVLG